jgi:hypothetical protein
LRFWYMEGYRLSPEKKTEGSCQRLVLCSWQYNILLNSGCSYAWYLQNLYCGCQNSVYVVICARFAVKCPGPALVRSIREWHFKEHWIEN